MEDKRRPLFMISVVCGMFDIHPQTLRIYEKEGLLHPQRVGRSRMYSQEDLERIRMILNLTRDFGVNRSGVDIILRMRHKLETLHREMEEMMGYLENDIRKEFEERIKEAYEEEE
ncbi:MAG TPA: MerR family transcriptional regulator [Nitrospirae bacterium]|nr:putative heat shock protein HspR [bacterium BMS3Abin10]GBE38361.1 putative heat shock protein HspR [bacterium BMS3Bbin08]HDH01477.1 MerR family transcriptional regulator [Nitrospirota bacterium]HDH50826.1 MerR family transcriptional regulator [Nitrospirota bacterium]HDK81684.1 MerR family transcriptional regulator [Nitrospirota bacterium]